MPRLDLKKSLSQPSWAPYPTRNDIIAACAVAIICGIASLFFSEVGGWDQRNYHIYNGWALWNNRLNLDLVPAQLQSYFVPWLDAIYWALQRVSPSFAGFAIGAWHGTCFFLLTAIAHLLLGEDSRKKWLAPALGLSGLFSAIFLQELGGTNGDNTTAPLVLGALLCILIGQRCEKTRWVFSAGILLGLALSLKMTNSIYAIGTASILIVAPGKPLKRLKNATLFTGIALAVFAICTAPWFWLVWQKFGNPIFPKFNTFFHSPLAGEVPAVYTYKIPKSWLEAFCLPLSLSFTPQKVHSAPQLTWALAWIFSLIGCCCYISRILFRSGARRSNDDPDATLILWTFIGVSFAFWMARFSVYRYLVVAELLCPLALWLLIERISPKKVAVFLAPGAALTCAISSAYGWKTTHSTGWLRSPIIVEAPMEWSPATSTVVLAGRGPQSWRIPFLSDKAIYVGGVGANFSTSPQYSEQIHAIASQRGGKVYTIFPSATSKWLDRAEAQNRNFADTGQKRCAQLQKYAQESHKRLTYVSQTGENPCNLRIRKWEQRHMEKFNHLRQQKIAKILLEYDWRLEAQSCIVINSRIGDHNYPYQWCELSSTTPTQISHRPN